MADEAEFMQVQCESDQTTILDIIHGHARIFAGKIGPCDERPGLFYSQVHPDSDLKPPTEHEQEHYYLLECPGFIVGIERRAKRFGGEIERIIRYWVTGLGDDPMANEIHQQLSEYMGWPDDRDDFMDWLLLAAFCHLVMSWEIDQESLNQEILFGAS